MSDMERRPNKFTIKEKALGAMATLSILGCLVPALACRLIESIPNGTTAFGTSKGLGAEAERSVYHQENIPDKTGVSVWAGDRYVKIFHIQTNGNSQEETAFTVSTGNKDLVNNHFSTDVSFVIQKKPYFAAFIRTLNITTDPATGDWIGELNQYP